MSIERVREYFRKLGIEDRVMEIDESSATVALAAKALGCEEGRIAKTISFSLDGAPILIVAAGDTKIDNAKYKSRFGKKAKMLSHEEAAQLIGHAVGGVCPVCRERRSEDISRRVTQEIQYGIPRMRQQQQHDRADFRRARGILQARKLGQCLQADGIKTGAAKKNFSKPPPNT